MKPFVPCSDDEYFSRLVTKAPYVEGWHTNTETLEDIEWLNLPLLEKSKGFLAKHRHVLAASAAVVALYGVPFKNLSLPFIHTSTLSPDAGKTVRRTVKHVAHFVEWFTHGAADERVYKDIGKIKRMHAYLARSMKQKPFVPFPDVDIPDVEEKQKFREAVKLDFKELKLENAFEHINRYNPEIYLSQFDMVMIQLDFVAAYMFPELHLIGDEEGLEGLLHHWAVIGRLLGIQDEFNLALHPSKELYFRILRNLMPCMLTMDLTFTHLLETYLEGTALYFHLPVTAPGLLYFINAVAFPEFKGTNLRKLMTVKDKFFSAAASGIMNLMFYSNKVKGMGRFLGTAFYSATSSGYHTLKRGDNYKFPL